MATMHMIFRFTPEALALVESHGMKGFNPQMPQGAPLAMAGDLVKIPAGLEQVSLAVLEREFEYLQTSVTVVFLLGLPNQFGT